MTPPSPTLADSGLTIFALIAAHGAMWFDRHVAVLTQRQEDLHWLATTGAGCLAGCAALLAIYRHVRAIRRERRPRGD